LEIISLELAAVMGSVLMRSTEDGEFVRHFSFDWIMINTSASLGIGESGIFRHRGMLLFMLAGAFLGFIEVIVVVLGDARQVVQGSCPGCWLGFRLLALYLPEVNLSTLVHIVPG
jgi:hypothetical protein